MRIQVEVSARHLHLSLKDCLILFGSSKLDKRNNLSQKDEFATNLVVELVGPKKSIHKVRVLGPLRAATQVEISKSDALMIGVDAPLALSGEGVGAEIRIVGPKGSVQSKVAMVARRHFHVCTDTAARLKLKNGQMVKAKVSGDRAVTFENIVVRISDRFVDRIHFDTDEGNAAGLEKESLAELIIR